MGRGVAGWKAHSRVARGASFLGRPRGAWPAAEGAGWRARVEGEEGGRSGRERQPCRGSPRASLPARPLASRRSLTSRGEGRAEGWPAKASAGRADGGSGLGGAGDGALHRLAVVGNAPMK